MRRGTSLPVSRLLLCGALAAAGPGGAAGVTLEDVIARLGEPAVIRGSYEQSRELAILEKPLESRGVFVLSELGLYWRQQSQPESVVIADGQRLVQRVGDNEPEVSDATTNPAVLPFSRIFLGLFRGDEASVRGHFEIGFAAHGDDWRIGLTPVTEPLSLAIDAIVLCGREYIDELTIVNRSGDRTVIRFRELRTEPGHLTEHEIRLYGR